MYDKVGAAAEYVCLPHDPNLFTSVASTNTWPGKTHIYGAEYEDNVFGSNVLQMCCLLYYIYIICFDDSWQKSMY